MTAALPIMSIFNFVTARLQEDEFLKDDGQKLVLI